MLARRTEGAVRGGGGVGEVKVCRFDCTNRKCLPSGLLLYEVHFKPFPRFAAMSFVFFLGDSWCLLVLQFLNLV